jgi:hypothetical protein
LIQLIQRQSTSLSYELYFFPPQQPFSLPSPNFVNDHSPPAVHHLFAVGLTSARPVQIFQPLHRRAVSQTHYPLPPQLRDSRDRAGARTTAAGYGDREAGFGGEVSMERRDITIVIEAGAVQPGAAKQRVEFRVIETRPSNRSPNLVSTLSSRSFICTPHSLISRARP